jgi:hypothetical protein
MMVMMVVVVVMMMVMMVVHSFAHRRGSGFLRHGVTRETNRESGGDDKALDHGDLVLL